jgi:hypothetical protein
VLLGLVDMNNYRLSIVRNKFLACFERAACAGRGTGTEPKARSFSLFLFGPEFYLLAFGISFWRRRNLLHSKRGKPGSKRKREKRSSIKSMPHEIARSAADPRPAGAAVRREPPSAGRAALGGRR